MHVLARGQTREFNLGQLVAPRETLPVGGLRRHVRVLKIIRIPKLIGYANPFAGAIVNPE